jgi:hypothetical protein
MGKEPDQPTINVLVEKFKPSPNCDSLIDTSKAFFDAHPRLKPEHVLHLFTGRLFEELAFLHYQMNLGEGFALLDPAQTLAYFRDLYDKNPRPTTTFQETADGYVPDGILFRSDEGGTGPVLSIIEYTGRKSEDGRDTYIAHKRQMARILRSRYPATFGKSNLEIVFPEGSRMQRPRLDTQTTIGYAPITYGEVRSLATQLVPMRSAQT